MDRTVNNLVLYLFCKLNEIGAESRYPDHNVTILIRILLGFFKCFSVNNVELNLFAPAEKVGFYCGSEFFPLPENLWYMSTQCANLICLPLKLSPALIVNLGIKIIISSFVFAA